MQPDTRQERRTRKLDAKKNRMRKHGKRYVETVGRIIATKAQKGERP